MTMTIKKKSTLAALALIVAGTATVAGTMAYADNNRGGMPGGAAMFDNADTDNDGQVTLAEFKAPLVERFKQADADSDGSVTAEEISAAMDAMRAERRAGGEGNKRWGGKGPRGHGGAERLLERVDVDGDGAVTLAELDNRQTKMFALMDIDDSGAIDADELPRRMAHRGERHGGGDRK